MRKYWFFDFDGTLFDTEEDIRQAWLATLAALKRPCPDFGARYRTGPSLGDMVAELFPDADDLPALTAAVRATFPGIYDASGFPATLPYEQAVGWLSELKAAGARLFVATNKRMNPTRLILKKFDMLDFFDGIYTSDMYLDAAQVPPGVPAGRALTKTEFLGLALAEHAIAPHDAVMVGDTCFDIAAGKAHALRTIAVRWGYGTEEELAGADEYVG